MEASTKKKLGIAALVLLAIGGAAYAASGTKGETDEQKKKYLKDATKNAFGPNQADAVDKMTPDEVKKVSEVVRPVAAGEGKGTPAGTGKDSTPRTRSSTMEGVTPEKKAEAVRILKKYGII